MSWSSRDAPRVTPQVRRIAGSLSVLGLVVSAPAPAQPVPRLEVDIRALASENPLLVTGSDRGAALVEVSARPGVTFTTPTGSTFDLGAEISNRRYSRRYGNFVTGSVDAAANYRDSEYLSIGASAGFARELAVDLLTSSVESATDPTSIRTSYVGRASVTWHPDQYTWVLPEISAEKFSFTRTGLLGDTRAVTASLAYRRRTSERTTLGVRAGSIFSNTERLSDTSTQFLYATIAQRLDAHWRASGELGVERNSARTEDLLGIGIDQPARTLLSGRAELCREAPGPVICVAGSLNSEVSGLGGLQRRAVGSASYRTALGERTSIDLAAEYQRTVMQGSVFPAFDAIRATATVERSLSSDLTVAATLQYLRRRLIEGTRVGALFAGLQLTFTPSLR
ncbi:hypothetical protein M0208_13520 [Sphingomonas sp. SUN019]|uniref:hypothetical protein n=1 Tax=Sphingomonas sp. SUN019 TaxID=2937788 RepID=UPI002164CA52|nr:hypothetical protein [Sphingomonas sp. SUN019]UVO51472.1 hypothetical protein M0208_13520 [Sphingomonas sp. SUN019]